MSAQTHGQVTAATGKFSVVRDNQLAGSGKVGGDMTGSDSNVSFVFLSRGQKQQADVPSEPVGHGHSVKHYSVIIFKASAILHLWTDVQPACRQQVRKTQVLRSSIVLSQAETTLTESISSQGSETPGMPETSLPGRSHTVLGVFYPDAAP